VPRSDPFLALNNQHRRGRTLVKTFSVGSKA